MKRTIRVGGTVILLLKKYITNKLKHETIYLKKKANFFLFCQKNCNIQFKTKPVLMQTVIPGQRI